MKKYLFYGLEAIGTVPFKVRNLRKTKNFGQKFSIFSSNLLTVMVIFGRICLIIYLNCVMYSRNSILMQNLDQTLIKPLNFWANFLLKCIFGQIRTC